MGKTRQKPYDPAAQRAKDLAAVGLQPEAAVLAQHDAVEVTRLAQEGHNGKKVAHDVARRMDAFEALKAGMERGAYDAARRFERDILTRRREAGAGRPMERVDCEPEREFAWVDAAIRVDEVTDRLPPRDWWLLMELISPRIEWAGWRETVKYITGETHPHAQGAAVRSACVNLRDAYEAIERRAAA